MCIYLTFLMATEVRSPQASHSSLRNDTQTTRKKGERIFIWAQVLKQKEKGVPESSTPNAGGHRAYIFVHRTAQIKKRGQERAFRQ